MAFIEVTDTSINKKVLLNTDWIKGVIPIDTHCAVIVGDGYFNPLNNDDIPEKYLIEENYDLVVAMIKAVH